MLKLELIFNKSAHSRSSMRLQASIFLPSNLYVTKIPQKMEEIKDLLNQVLSNQVAIYKRLEQIENKIKGNTRLAGDETYVKELKREGDKFKKYI